MLIAAMVTARFCFYAELNDFLARERRKREFEYRCARAATVKNAIEALGIPHTEAEVILVNGRSVDFSYLVREGDRVSVYPRLGAPDSQPLRRVREEPSREPRFVADTHLGGLARLLRTLGFDTLYGNELQDEEILSLAGREGRIILTRDRALLKRREVTHGCFIHSVRPCEQIREIVERLQLAVSLKPFTCCIHCNHPLAPVDKAAVLDCLPPGVGAAYERFFRCEGCGHVYWQGWHWDEVRRLLGNLLPTTGE